MLAFAFWHLNGSPVPGLNAGLSNFTTIQTLSFEGVYRRATVCVRTDNPA